MPSIKFDSKENDSFERIIFQDSPDCDSKEEFHDLIRKRKGYRLQKKQSTARKEKITRENLVSIDLHGFTSDEALNKLEKFLLKKEKENHKTILVITGKGLNSGPNGPVLKKEVENWLKINPRKIVRSYSQAPRKLGDSGAFLVYLK